MINRERADWAARGFGHTPIGREDDLAGIVAQQRLVARARTRGPVAPPIEGGPVVTGNGLGLGADEDHKAVGIGGLPGFCLGEETVRASGGERELHCFSQD